MAENKYQSKLIKTLQKCGFVVLKNDPQYKQGILDLTVLFEDRWGMLEVKDDMDSPLQPNQQYYLDLFNGMSFAAKICPENEGEVLSALQQALAPGRRACVSKS